MNKSLTDFLSRALRPPYVVLMTCLLLFLSTTAEISSLERQAAPMIAELKGTTTKGYGIDSFAHEYLADPFGKAIGLSEHQLQLCREIASFVPAYQANLRWRKLALWAGILTLLFLAYKKPGSRLAAIVAELRRKLNMAAIQQIVREAKSQAARRFPQAQRKATPMKGAVVSNIVRCPSCNQELRVPSGKGRIRITCAGCGHKFETTT